MTEPTRSSRSSCVASSPDSRPRATDDPDAAVTFRQRLLSRNSGFTEKGGLAIQGVLRMHALSELSPRRGSEGAHRGERRPDRAKGDPNRARGDLLGREETRSERTAGQSSPTGARPGLRLALAPRCWAYIAERALPDPDPANCAKRRAKIRRITQSEMYFALDGQSGVRRPYPQAALPVQAGGA
jgi:hypothetical protein